MRSWQKISSSEIRSIRLGDRATGSRAWTRRKIWLSYLCLLLLAFCVSSGFFALTSEAAYSNVTATTTAEVVEISKFFAESSSIWETKYSEGSSVAGLVTVYCDVVLKYSMSFTGTYFYNTPYELRGRVSSRLKCVWNNGTSFTDSDGRTIQAPFPSDMIAEIIDIWSLDYLGGDFDTMVGETEYSQTNPSNQTFTLYTSFRKELGAGTGNAAPIYYQKVRLHFAIDASSTYLNSRWFTQPKPTVTITMSTPTSFRIQESADSIPFAKQNADNLQSLVNGIINDPAAGSVMDAANDNFVQEAGALQSGQAVLEGAADNSMAAVDFGQVDLIDTYSGSVNFWMSLINQLPTILGAFWSVLIFALIIAFVLFIVRIRR